MCNKFILLTTSGAGSTNGRPGLDQVMEADQWELTVLGTVHIAELNICRGNLLADKERERREREEEREDRSVMDDDGRAGPLAGPANRLVRLSRLSRLRYSGLLRAGKYESLAWS